MSVTIRSHDDETALVDVGRRLDFRNAGEVRDRCVGRLEEGTRYFIFDFDETTTLDSTGLSAIFSLYRKLKPAGGRIVFVNVSSTVRAVVQVTSTQRIFDFFPDVEAARQRLAEARRI